MTLLIIFIALALAACCFDAWTTNRCIKVGLEETGILTKRVIGTKPSPSQVYGFILATWCVFTALSIYAFSIVALWALAPSIEQIVEHGWAGYHNQKLYTAWTLSSK